MVFNTHPRHVLFIYFQVVINLQIVHAHEEYDYNQYIDKRHNGNYLGIL